MAKQKGVLSGFYDGSTRVPITDLTLGENMVLVEDSDIGDAGENQEPTQFSGDVSGNGNFDPAQSGHTGLVTKLRAGTPIAFTWINSGTKGSGSAVGVTGTFVLSQFTRKTDKKGLVPFSFTGKANGIFTDASNL